MKTLLATTALVLVMGGSALAASSQPLNTYQAQPTDIRASQFIGQTVYATDNDVNADQAAQAGAEKDWDNVGDINEVILGRDGEIKAVVLGVGGFLGIGEKKVAVSMDDVKFVRNGDGASDYFLVINANKETLTQAPAYDANMQAADNAAETDEPAAGTTTAQSTANPSTTAGEAGTLAGATAGAAAGAAAGSATNADTQAARNQATNTLDSTAARTDSAGNMETTAGAGTATTQQEQTAQNSGSAQNTGTAQDMQTTGSTQSGSAVDSAMNDSRTRLTAPNITREGYRIAQASELTAEKLQGARVYGTKDEDVGEINRLVLNNSGQIQYFVLDIGGFLGMGEREIAVTPQELNIVRNEQGDDLRVYIDANKDMLSSQPEYKAEQ